MGKTVFWTKRRGRGYRNPCKTTQNLITWEKSWWEQPYQLMV